MLLGITNENEIACVTTTQPQAVTVLHGSAVDASSIICLRFHHDLHALLHVTKDAISVAFNVDSNLYVTQPWPALLLVKVLLYSIIK